MRACWRAIFRCVRRIDNAKTSIALTYRNVLMQFQWRALEPLGTLNLEATWKCEHSAIVLCRRLVSRNDKLPWTVVSHQRLAGPKTEIRAKHFSHVKHMHNALWPEREVQRTARWTIAWQAIASTRRWNCHRWLCQPIKKSLPNAASVLHSSDCADTGNGVEYLMNRIPTKANTTLTMTTMAVRAVSVLIKIREIESYSMGFLHFSFSTKRFYFYFRVCSRFSRRTYAISTATQARLESVCAFPTKTEKTV